jgi:hypothetical protein
MACLPPQGARPMSPVPGLCLRSRQRQTQPSRSSRRSGQQCKRKSIVFRTQPLAFAAPLRSRPGATTLARWPLYRGTERPAPPGSPAPQMRICAGTPCSAIPNRRFQLFDGNHVAYLCPHDWRAARRAQTPPPSTRSLGRTRYQGNLLSWLSRSARGSPPIRIVRSDPDQVPSASCTWACIRKTHPNRSRRRSHLRRAGA